VAETQLFPHWKKLQKVSCRLLINSFCFQQKINYMTGRTKILFALCFGINYEFFGTTGQSVTINGKKKVSTVSDKYSHCSVEINRVVRSAPCFKTVYSSPWVRYRIVLLCSWHGTLHPSPWITHAVIGLHIKVINWKILKSPTCSFSIFNQILEKKSVKQFSLASLIKNKMSLHWVKELSSSFT
jgi:RNase P/RNase MRP subunit p29